MAMTWSKSEHTSAPGLAVTITRSALVASSWPRWRSTKAPEVETATSRSFSPRVLIACAAGTDSVTSGMTQCSTAIARWNSLSSFADGSAEKSVVLRASWMPRTRASRSPAAVRRSIDSKSRSSSPRRSKPGPSCPSAERK